MDSKDYCSQLFDYFNEALSDEEKAAFEKHLLTCQECQDELQELQELTEDLPYLSEPVIPPSGMKSRILAQVFDEEDKSPGSPSHSETEQAPEAARPVEENTKTAVHREPAPSKRRRTWLIPALAAALFLSIGANVWLANHNSDSQGQIAANLQNQVQLASTEGSSKMTATASLLKSDQKNQVVLQAANLKGLSKGESYQVWLIEKDKPYPAGYFVPDQSGKGTVVYTVPEDQQHNWDTVAITVETEHNPAAPKGQVLLAGKL